MGTAGSPCSSSSARFHASQKGSAAGGRDRPRGSSNLPVVVGGQQQQFNDWCGGLFHRWTDGCVHKKDTQTSSTNTRPPGLLPAFLSSFSAAACWSLQTGNTSRRELPDSEEACAAAAWLAPLAAADALLPPPAAAAADGAAAGPLPDCSRLAAAGVLGVDMLNRLAVHHVECCCWCCWQRQHAKLAASLSGLAG